MTPWAAACAILRRRAGSLEPSLGRWSRHRGRETGAHDSAASRWNPEALFLLSAETEKNEELQKEEYEGNGEQEYYVHSVHVFAAQ